jgi:hypothetical protein
MGLCYKNAFRCKKCPGTNDQPDGCPMWWEMILTNDATEAKKVEKGCGYQLLPQMLALTCKQSMHTTYAAYDMRNKVVKNVGKVITAVKDQLKLDIPEEVEEVLQIEGEQDEIPRN